AAHRPVGRVGADGRFRLSTYLTGDGAPAGDYTVLVVWPGPAAPAGGPPPRGAGAPGRRGTDPATGGLPRPAPAAPPGGGAAGGGGGGGGPGRGPTGGSRSGSIEAGAGRGRRGGGVADQGAGRDAPRCRRLRPSADRPAGPGRARGPHLPTASGLLPV